MCLTRAVDFQLALEIPRKMEILAAREYKADNQNLGK